MNEHRWTWITGAWYFEAIGAPFPPHVMIFNSDKTLISSNPDRGEANNSASSGIGVWDHENLSERHHSPQFRGRFIEVNADPVNHQHSSNLIVDFMVTLTGDRFEGPAQSAIYAPDGMLIEQFPEVTLKGQRITLSSLPPVTDVAVS